MKYKLWGFVSSYKKKVHDNFKLHFPMLEKKGEIVKTTRKTGNVTWHVWVFVKQIVHYKMHGLYSVLML